MVAARRGVATAAVATADLPASSSARPAVHQIPFRGHSDRRVDERNLPDGRIGQSHRLRVRICREARARKAAYRGVATMPVAMATLLVHLRPSLGRCFGCPPVRLELTNNLLLDDVIPHTTGIYRAVPLPIAAPTKMAFNAAFELCLRRSFLTALIFFLLLGAFAVVQSNCTHPCHASPSEFTGVAQASDSRIKK
jgi:hypothetical protein